MNSHPSFRTPLPASRAAFTLVELLVVIGIISVLAALGVSVTGGIRRNQMKARARAELEQVQTAIEHYKTKRGYYPPDNPTGDWKMNSLYYELVGVKDVTGGGFQTLDGRAYATDLSPISAAGPKPLNYTRDNGDDLMAITFIRNLRPDEFLALSSPGFTVLGTAVSGPDMLPTDGPKINPWGYRCTNLPGNPLTNSASFDLWIDISLGSDTFRISNWSQNPQQL